MKNMSDEFVDLIVTSPPYDSLRDYKGYNFPFEEIVKEFYRIVKQGGVVVWIVGDQTIDGSETGTSFKQALFFKEVGFNIHDTMIWHKRNPPPTDPRLHRYIQEMEYMFIFSKGKPSKCNYLKEPCKYAGLSTKGKGTQRKVNGETREDIFQRRASLFVKDYKILGNIWEMNNGGYEGHPATFPEELANNHIISWSNEGDLVYDPFMGSGTTAKMCITNKRNYIGSEISKEYCDIIKKRLNSVSESLF